jgi:serine/threonine protein kinase
MLPANQINIASQPLRTVQSLSTAGSVPAQRESEIAKPKMTFTVEDFEFHEKIGSGKFGMVYKAIERKSKKTVAIK